MRIHAPTCHPRYPRRRDYNFGGTFQTTTHFPTLYQMENLCQILGKVNEVRVYCKLIGTLDLFYPNNKKQPLVLGREQPEGEHNYHLEDGESVSLPYKIDSYNLFPYNIKYTSSQYSIISHRY